jgi:vacuolar-type H+-ATPase subunit C/Vma6
MDMEASHFRLISCSSETDDVASECSETDYQRQISEALGAYPKAKVLSFKERAPVAKEG